MLRSVDHGALITPPEQAAIERIVTNRAGGRIRLDVVEQIRADDDRVLRVTSGDSTWIVKRAGGQSNERLYGPWGFFAEWVAAETVTATRVEVSPDFLGGDPDARLMVSEDVGPGLDVSQVLRGTDAEAAATALAAMGAALGRMHAATALPSVEDGYRARWRELCGDRPQPKITLPASTLTQSLNEALAEAKIDFAFGTGDLAELQAWGLEERAGWALIHGDPCLDNWILDHAGRPRLIDFQAASFAPAALDAAYARAPFPTCWCLRRLPREVVERFEEEHRAALAAAGNKLGDRVIHERHLTFALAWWCAVQILWRIAPASAGNTETRREHLGFRLVPLRDSILLRLESFLDHSSVTGHLPSLAQQAADLRALLLDRWSASDVDLYPAFGGQPG